MNLETRNPRISFSLFSWLPGFLIEM